VAFEIRYTCSTLALISGCGVEASFRFLRKVRYARLTYLCKVKIAYILYENQGNYHPDQEAEHNGLLRFLREKGLDIHPETWTDQDVNWAGYDLAVLKAPWDYFDKIELFYQWLAKLDGLGVRLLNPAPLVKWNADKHYLADIEAASLPVTPTAFLERGSTADLSAYFDRWDTDRLIVKPCISGGSKNTFAFDRLQAPAIEARLNALLHEEAFLVQPFIPQIEKEGEWSFLFFNGRFSHCLLKKPEAGDFRVQQHFGGTIHPTIPPAGLLVQAGRYVAQFAEGCLYARVDGVLVNGRLLLMELEIIEPFLYLSAHPESYYNYYQALKELLALK
jgi:glutathione synthase/RimK-type ligase-like ATP-grasp enzyme